MWGLFTQFNLKVYIYAIIKLLTKIMLKTKLSIILLIFFFLIGCQTVKKKTDEILDKENKKLSEFIGKSSIELNKSLGEPDENFKNESGNFVFVYKNKKYGILCERSFEINSQSIVIGFVSKGCF